MRSRLTNFLQNKAFFWKSLTFFENKVSFRAFKQAYRIKNSWREEKISARLLSYSIKGVLSTVSEAAVLVAIAELISKHLTIVHLTIGYDDLGILLSTVVTIVGVFLGLYFTALSAVAGSLFMRAPSNLQILFLRDRKGRQYVKTLVLVIAVGIYYLLLRSFGYQVGFLGPILITAMALFAVVRIMTLGAQTFYFIHPIEASSTLTNDAINAIDSATARGFGWKKPYLQNHYHKQAETALATLGSLVDFGINPIKLSGQQFYDIAKYTGVILNYYLSKKKQIPTDSYWYSTKYQHQNWLLASDTSLTMALNTGTSLAPKSIKDQNWFEDACIGTLLKIFEHQAAAKQWGYAQATLEVVVKVLENAGENFYEDIASSIVEKVQASIGKVIITEDNPSNQDDKAGHLALMDAMGRLPTAVLVSLARYIDKRTCSDLAKEVAAVKWAKQKSIYSNKLPGRLLPSLENTHSAYKNELTIEGEPVSPDWYLLTITTQQYLTSLKRYYDYVKSLNKDFYEKQIEELVKRHKYLQAAHLTDCWIEFSNKLLSLGWKVQQLIEQCEAHKKVQDLPWTSMDAETEKQTVQGFNQQAIDKLVFLLPYISSLPESELKDLPDYFGQAYTFGVEAAYRAAHDNETQRLKSLFPSIFLGALTAYQSTRKEVEGWSEQSKIIFTTEPLEDILTLSGFIKIYAELYDNQELWSICEDTWNKYLSVSDAKSVIELLVAGVQYRDSQFGLLMPKAVLRTNWDMRLRRKFEELGLAVDMFQTRFDDQDDTPTHASPLIRMLSRESGVMSVDARNIFFITYLSKHQSVESADIDFPDRRDLEQRLNREAGAEEQADEQD